MVTRDEDICSTPLGWAAEFGRKPMVELLLQRGAKPNLPDDPPWATPLAWATRRNHPDVVQVLLHHGARMNVSDGEGRAHFHNPTIESTDRTMRTLCGICLGMISIAACAHPGGGIVALSESSTVFVDPPAGLTPGGFRRRGASSRG